ncbi:MAG: DEAD/DEAH box helicase family protein, partial [Bacteroidota bacterium]
MITLRPNQVKPVQVGIDYFNSTKPAPAIIVAPTAAGKSIIIAKIVEGINDKVVILQPSIELLNQNHSKYSMIGGKASIYSASAGQKNIGNVTYATIGSIVKLGEQFKAQGFTKMIIDEVHLFPREEGMLGRFLAASGITHVLGLTATPLKLQNNVDVHGNPFSKLVMLTSKSKNGQFFKDIIHVTQVSEMVELGFWAKLEYEQYDIDESGLKYNSTKADYTEASLKAVYESNNITGKIIQKIADIPKRKSIIVFVPSVQEAITLSRMIPNSVAVYGDMGKKERDHAITFFKKGIIRVVINVNVLSVGFDHPELDTIICARPTASLAWLYQA